MAICLQVRADLVRATSLQPHGDQTASIDSRDFGQVRDGSLSSGVDRHANAVRLVSRQREVDPHPLVRDVARHDRRVASLDPVALDLRSEVPVRLIGFRHENQARGVLVEAMYDAGAKRLASTAKHGLRAQQGIDQGGLFESRRGMRRQASGLVNHDRLLILINDIERDHCRAKVVRRSLLRLFQPNRHAGSKLERRLCRLAIDQDFAGRNYLHELRPAEFRQLPSQKSIQPLNLMRDELHNCDSSNHQRLIDLKSIALALRSGTRIRSHAVNINDMALAVLALLLAQPIVPALITYTSPGGTAQSVLAELSRAAGSRLEAAPAVADDILVLRLDKAPLDVAMAKIADAADGDWRQDGGSYLLERSAQKVREREAKEDEIRAQHFQSAIDSAAEQSRGAFDKATAQKLVELHRDNSKTLPDVATLGLKAPSGRAIAAIAKLIGADTLARLPIGRSVFATVPNRMQLPLPSSVAEPLRRFVAEQKMYADLYKGQDTSAGNEVRVFGGIGMPYMGPGSAEAGIGKSLLIVYRTVEPDSLVMTLVAYDPEGLEIANGDYSISPGAYAPQNPPDPNNELVGLPTMGSEIAMAIQNISSGGRGRSMFRMVSIVNDKRVEFSSTPVDPAPKPIRDALRQVLLNPDSVEPLALVAGPALVEAAEKEGIDLVADLPDSTFAGFCRAAGSAKSTAGALLSTTAAACGLEVDRNEGWAAIRPSAPDVRLTSRVERKPLGRMLREADRQGFLGMESVARFLAAQRKNPGFEDMDGLYLRLLNPSAFAMISGGAPLNALRVYGLMGAGQRGALLRGQRLLIRDLPPAARAAFDREVYNDAIGPTVDIPTPSSGAYVDGRYRALGAERTEAMPMGTPPDGVLTMKTDEKPAVLARDPQNGQVALWSADNIASMRYQAERPDLGGPTNADRFTRFQLAQMDSPTLHVDFSPKVTMSWTFTDARLDPTSTPTGYSGLPASFRDAVDATLAALRQAFTLGAGNTRRPRTPPPG